MADALAASVSQPDKVIQSFLRDVREELGVEGAMPWTLQEFNRRIAWGKFKSFQRMRYLLCHVLQLIDKGKAAQAGALVTQGTKALHQGTLDGGNWRVGRLLTGLPDPVGRKVLGGGEEELEVAANYIKAVEELQKRTRSGGRDRNTEHGEDGEKPWRKKQGKDKGGKGEKFNEKGHKGEEKKP